MEQTTFYFLGTGAADWDQRQPDGELRRFTSTLIDGHILMDFTSAGFDLLGERQADVDTVFLTHSHPDHFEPEAIERLAAGRTEPLILYAHRSIASEIRTAQVNVIPLDTENPVSCGPYKVMPLPSNHASLREYEQTLHYLFFGPRSFLYALDGGWLSNREAKLIRGTALDAVIMDCTIGDGYEGDCRIFEHNSLPMIRIMEQTLRKTGMMKQAAPLILTHFAKTLHPSQAELQASLSPLQLAAYDGLTVCIS